MSLQFPIGSQASRKPPVLDSPILHVGGEAVRCPACGESEPDLVEELTDGRVFCAACRKVSPLDGLPPRIVLPVERRERKDTDA